MRRPSLTFIICVIFLVYVTHSIYGMLKLIIPPSCEKGERCYNYYLRSIPKLQLLFFTSVKNVPRSRESTLVYSHPDFNPNIPFEKELNIDLPKATKNNGTLCLHIFLLRQDFDATTFREASSDNFHIYTRVPLVQYQIPSVNFELLKGDEINKSMIPINHIKTEVGFNILTGIEVLPEKNMPPELYRFIKFAGHNIILPVMHHNYLNDRNDKLQPVSNLSSIPLTLKYSPINIGKFRLSIHAELVLNSFKDYGFNDKDLDQIKSIFSSTNIYLLGITIFISSCHFIFDFLAIKSDVKFWQTRTTLAGLSLKSVIWRAFSQIIIFLYLLDEETSLLILIPTGVGTLIEFWKVHKVMPFDWKKFKFKQVKLSKEEQLTRNIDADGMKYLSYILYPLCISGALYSLLYLQHKSWYSWVIHSLVNGVYGFGFLFMLPQLFINYKLKSVAHLPWKTFMYKAFNTFIDDLFAFIIDMPVAHRIACFRDDVVFVIYLYQRWLYPVDQTRLDSGDVAND